MDRATGLIERVLANPDRSDLDELANELLSEYYRGSDLSSLRNLLHSGDHRIVACSTWIACELGEVGKPLLCEVQRLLEHPSKRVRFWAIECVQEWAGLSNGHEIASAVALVDDAEEAVRWKAMVFLALASREQLQAGVNWLTTADPESPYLAELRWILAPEGADPDQIANTVRGISSRRRKFAAASAFRIAKTDPQPLERAESADDPEVAQFAGDMLKRIKSV
ncbi:MAG: hypothetical protein WBM24_18760 [Candidatus Sulfotelmatobacter sp.]